MYNFFAETTSREGENFFIIGQDFNHIKNVLRMKTGDTFLVSCEGVSYLCELAGFEDSAVKAEIIEENYKDTSTPVKIYLFQGLPKGDKMELIIQKAVELGAEGIIPVEMSRCVVKLDDKKKKSKQTRWQAIAESAAKQSKRTAVPKVYMPLSYEEALKNAAELDILLVPYENEEGMSATLSALKSIKKDMSVGILIGPEGGFGEREIESATLNGGKIISLGKRILRTETAAITAVGMCMLYSEMISVTGSSPVTLWSKI